jgi:hypothetical protein
VGDEVFGQIITGDDVRNAMKETLQLWIGTYLAVIARKTGRAGGDLQGFKSYPTLFDINKYAEDIMPACVLVAPGILSTPILEKGGYRATWGVGLGCVVAGKDRDNTYQLATLYTAAARSLVLQHPSLGGFADGVNWISERYDNLDSSDVRTIAAGVIQFGVDVVDVVDPRAGTMTPAPDLPTPVDAWPAAEQVIIDAVPRS